MQRCYSKTTETTYLRGVHTGIPGDAVDIDEATYQQIIATVPPGFVRSHDAAGRPILVEAPPSLPTAPTTITMRQARRCLHRHGMLSGVQAAIDTLPEPDRTDAQIEWDYSAVVERHRGLVVAIAESLGLTDEQLDELFIEAATL